MDYNKKQMNLKIAIITICLGSVLNSYAQQNFFRSNNSNVVPTAASNFITNGLVLNLDSSTPSSYIGSGSNWLDISGSNNNALLSNNPVFSSVSPKYFEFSGSNNANLNFAGTTEFTFSLWLYSIGAPGGGFSRIVSISPNDNLEIAINSSHQISYHSPSVGWQSNKLSTIANTWYQLVVVKSTNNISFYINGEIKHTATLSSFTPGTKLFFGQRYNGGEGVNMRLGSVLVYNYPLSQSDITLNFNSTKARFGF